LAAFIQPGIDVNNQRTSASETGAAFPDTRLARLIAPEALARRLADGLAETLDPGEAVVAVFETSPGWWSVEIHFEHEPDSAALRSLVADLAGESVAADLSYSTIAAKDWVAASLAGLHPVPAGRFMIHGAHDRARVPSSCIGIEIEAALAFGTGHHGTTRGCLLALDWLVDRRKPRPRSKPPGRRPHPRHRRQPPADVLDIGTGTGVLAIAAARALRRRVRASDIDRASIVVAGDNIRRNRAAPLIDLVHAGGVGDRRIAANAPYAIVLANILLPPLKRMAAPMARLVAPGGHVILSGILDAQAAAILAAYRLQGLWLRRRISLDGWTTLVLTRAAGPGKKKRPE
jgi:ribosomal protein L11 methyltransferase